MDERDAVFEVLTTGRVGVDLYPMQSGVSLDRVETFLPIAWWERDQRGGGAPSSAKGSMAGRSCCASIWTILSRPRRWRLTPGRGRASGAGSGGDDPAVRIAPGGRPPGQRPSSRRHDPGHLGRVGTGRIVGLYLAEGSGGAGRAPGAAGVEPACGHFSAGTSTTATTASLTGRKCFGLPTVRGVVAGRFVLYPPDGQWPGRWTRSWVSSGERPITWKEPKHEPARRSMNPRAACPPQG